MFGCGNRLLLQLKEITDRRGWSNALLFLKKEVIFFGAKSEISSGNNNIKEGEW